MFAASPQLRLALGLTVACLAGSGASVAERVPIDRTLLEEIRAYCNTLYLTGLFHQGTYACVPGLREAAEGKLCKADVGQFFRPYAAGFGSGPSLRAGASDPLRTVLFQPQDWSEVVARAVDCPPNSQDEAPGELELAGDPYEDVQRAMAFWEPERMRLPLSVREPWEACAALQSQPRVAKRTEVRCQAIGSFDLSGEGEEVFFEAYRILPYAAMDALVIPLRQYRGPKLRADLEVTGADCHGREWKKGMRLRHVGAMRCRRLGRSEVTFHLPTSKGDCWATLPELTEPPLAELCGSTNAAR